MVVNFNAAAVRFGQPGVLYVNTPGATEPTTATAPWATSWIPLGYTDAGSQFNYSISVDNVEVAEELDVFARATTGRDASVEFSLATGTKRNLNIVFNGGIVLGDNTAWEFYPPDLGTEARIGLGWDAVADYDTSGGTPTVGKNDLRFIFRRCLSTGNITIENRKGTQKRLLPATFGLEKPLMGSGNAAKILKVMGTASLNPLDPTS